MSGFLSKLKRRLELDVRQRSARRFLVALKRATHRLPATLSVPLRSRVLVIAPHADDEVIPCGGTLLRHRDLGSTVRVVYATDSSAGIADAAAALQLKQIRFDESESVSRAMRFESVVRLDLPDAHLVQHESALTARFVEQIESFQPQLVYCPFPGDGHADHQACAIALAEAVTSIRWHGTIHAYEVWTTLWPNILVDISNHAEEKETLVRLHASQMADRDYASAVLGLNRYRGLQHKVAFAEAFYASDAQEFSSLAQLLNRVSPMPKS